MTGKEANMYDVVWFWTGGREEGEWRPSTVRAKDPKHPTRKEIHEHRAALDRAGYVNHSGSTRIGPPEGPPSDAEFKALGL